MPIDLDAAQNWLKNAQSRKRELGVYDNDGGGFFTPRANSETNLRIIAVASDWFSGSHWNVLQGKDGKMGGTVKCPMVFEDGPCPVCETYRMFINSKDPKEQERAKKIKLQVKHPMLVVNLDDSGSTKVLIYEAVNGVWEQIIKYSAKYGDITDLKNGRNVVLTRTDVNGGPTKYNVMPEPDRTAFKIDQNIKMLTEEDLKKALKPRSYADIEFALLNGVWPTREQSEEEVEESTPPPRRQVAQTQERKPTPYSKGLPKTKTVDEEVVESESAEEFEEAPAPKAAVRKAAPPPPEEVEEEDVDPAPRALPPQRTSVQSDSKKETVQEKIRRQMEEMKMKGKK